MTISIRERVRAIQVQLRDSALTPAVARDSLIVLTAILGNVNDEQRLADHDYKLVLLGCMEAEKKANRARIVAETSAQYLRAREAKDTEKQVIETIRSCKAYLRSLDEEMRLGTG